MKKRSIKETSSKGEESAGSVSAKIKLRALTMGNLTYKARRVETIINNERQEIKRIVLRRLALAASAILLVLIDR